MQRRWRGPRLRSQGQSLSQATGVFRRTGDGAAVRTLAKKRVCELIKTALICLRRDAAVDADTIVAGRKPCLAGPVTGRQFTIARNFKVVSCDRTGLPQSIGQA
ncbi:hypothetical protein MACH17_04280 [Phaeobacter inhibens]|nr:hypothetical protein MACH17_04280 [Phaeobacter inhibens]